MKKLFNIILICAILGTLNFSLSVDAQTTQNIETLVEITKADPDKPVLQTLVTQDSQTLESKQGDLELEIDLKDQEITIKQNDGEDIEISLPNNLGLKSGQKIGDSVVFDGPNVDVVVQAVGGGIRQVLNIDNANAGNVFDFPLTLANNETLEITPEGFGLIKNAEGKVITTILKPWAKDKNGKELPTHYTAEGNVLKQHINFENAVFPVSADPAWCGDIADNVWWHKNGKDEYFGLQPWSLRIKPSWCGRTISATAFVGIPVTNFGPSAMNHWFMWQEIVNKTPDCAEYKRKRVKIRGVWKNMPYCYDSPWDKTYGTSIYWSTYDQFFCHAYNPKTLDRPEWNLEPKRPNVGFVKTVKAGCNPD